MKRGGDGDKRGNDQPKKAWIEGDTADDAGAGLDARLARLASSNLTKVAKRLERLESSALQLSHVKGVAELSLHVLDSWTVAEIKGHIDSLCSSSPQLDYSGCEQKEELKMLVTRFWFLNPERMPECIERIKKK